MAVGGSAGVSTVVEFLQISLITALIITVIVHRDWKDVCLQLHPHAYAGEWGEMLLHNSSFTLYTLVSVAATPRGGPLHQRCSSNKYKVLMHGVNHSTKQCSLNVVPE